MIKRRFAYVATVIKLLPHKLSLQRSLNVYVQMLSCRHSSRRVALLLRLFIFGFSLSCVFSILPDTSMGQSGPVGWWKFDESSGTTAADSSGSGNTGSLINGPVWTSGQIGNALSFDGSNDVVNAGSSASLDDLPALTLSAWINPATATYGPQGLIATKGHGNIELLYEGWVAAFNTANPTSLEFRVKYSTTDLQIRVPSNSATMNEWQHIAITWDGSANAAGVKIYKNGSELTYTLQQNGVGTRVSDSTRDFRIGDNAYANSPFKGMLDDIRIYNRVLSASEIQSVYNAGAPAIVSLSPAVGPVGTSVTITGSNFGASQGSSTVTFNGTAASPSSWGNTSIVASVPAGATTGPVVVTVGGVASNGVTFTVGSTGPVSGTVSRASDGSAISGALVEALQSGVVKGSATTAGNGTYSIGNLLVGTYDLRASASGYTVQAQNGIAVNAGAATTVNFSMNQPNGLVGWWKFDESSGSAAFDSSGSGNTGSLINGPVWTSGKIGNALSFDGSNDVVNAGSSASLDDLPALTLSAWINPATATYGPQGTVATKGHGSIQLLYEGWIAAFNGNNPTSLEFRVKYSTTDIHVRVPTTAFTMNEWQHVTITWDGSANAAGVKVHKNGSELTYTLQQNGAGTRGSDSPRDFRIGDNFYADTPFKGAIDDVRIYNRVLSQSEIQSVYNAGAPAITSLSPVVGPVGTSVTITGSNFGTSQGSSTITFNGTAASPKTVGAIRALLSLFQREQRQDPL